MFKYIFAVSLMLFILCLYFYYESKSFIQFFNIGQGDAILFKSTSGKVYLIDSGPSNDVDYEVFKNMLPNSFFLPCKIDTIFVTHPHKDHIKGFTRLLKRCKVDTVVIANFEYDSNLYYFLKKQIQGLNVVSFYQGDVYKAQEAVFYVLWPPKNFTNKDVNQMSLSLLLDINDFEVFMAGDLEKPYLDMLDFDLLSRVIDGDLDVYKVSHHGSKIGVSDKILKLFEPKISVISVGQNSYGHPSKEAIQLLNKFNTKTYFTNIDGNIKVTYNEQHD